MSEIYIDLRFVLYHGLTYAPVFISSCWETIKPVVCQFYIVVKHKIVRFYRNDLIYKI